MFQITLRAAGELARATRQGDCDGLGLRIAAREDADGRIQVGLGFDEAREQDRRIELEGLTVLLGALSQDLLDGARMDWQETAPGRHEFVFEPADPGCATTRPGTCGSGGGCSRCGG